jgi:protein-S-isoprenylcysteine O-methyltransferase Ste14
VTTWAPRLGLVLLLGCTFVHFLLAGSRTFVSNGDDDTAAWLAEISFIWGGAAATLILGLYVPVHLYNGIASLIVLACSLALYEWARHIVWGRKLYVAWSGGVPDDVCAEGPYAYIRHPIYASYILAFLAVLIAIPTVVTAIMLAFNVVLFTHAALSDERSLRSGALAGDYAQYRKRTGMFLPRIVRSVSTAD